MKKQESVSLSQAKTSFSCVASPEISLRGPIFIEGTVDDSAEPLQLKVLQFKSLK